MSDAPITFIFQRWKALFFGLLAFVLVGILSAAMIKAFLLEELPKAAVLIFFAAVAVSFGSKAIEYLSIFIRRPIALRVDSQGIKPYNLSPIPWQDIKTVTALQGRKRHRYLGITLQNPDKFRADQTGTMALRTKFWHWRYGQDIVLEGFLLRTNEVEKIAQAVTDFRAAQL